jgi:hypothetical protein
MKSVIPILWFLWAIALMVAGTSFVGLKNYGFIDGIYGPGGPSPALQRAFLLGELSVIGFGTSIGTMFAVSVALLVCIRHRRNRSLRGFPVG